MTWRETKLGRALCITLCGLLLAGALSACGKRGSPAPPKGEESVYFYPGTYPDPASVLAGTKAEKGESRRAPADAGGITTFPTTTRTKTTYGSGAVQ